MKLINLLLTSIILLLGISRGVADSQVNGFFLKGNAKSIKIPVEIQHNVILIPVRINGSFEMNFILDTGVKTTILTEPMMAEFFSLPPLTPVKVRGLGDGGAIEAGLARNISMALPGIEGKGIQMLVLPEGIISYSSMFGKPVVGILGYELFGQFTVEINYQQKYIRVYEPFRFKPRKKWHSIPIDIRGSKPYVAATLTDHRGERIQADWLLDTGASMAVSLFDEELPIPDPSVKAFLGQGLSGGVYGRLGRSVSLDLEHFRFENIVTGYPDSASLNLLPSKQDWYGNIGAEVISRFRIVFDYPRERILVRKSHTFQQPFEYNFSGLEVLSYGNDYDQFVISYVRPDSPADHAGVREGDRIISLNGIPVQGSSIDTLYGSLLKRTNRVIVLKLRRDDTVFRTRFYMKSEI